MEFIEAIKVYLYIFHIFVVLNTFALTYFQNNGTLFLSNKRGTYKLNMAGIWNYRGQITRRY